MNHVPGSKTCDCAATELFRYKSYLCRVLVSTLSDFASAPSIAAIPSSLNTKAPVT